jgi:hypothetical protein
MEKNIKDSEPKQCQDVVVETVIEEQQESQPENVTPTPHSRPRRSSSTISVRYTPAAIRIRKTQFSCLAKQFTETMMSYQLDQVNYRDQTRTRLKRQLEISMKIFGIVLLFCHFCILFCFVVLSKFNHF